MLTRNANVFYEESNTIQNATYIENLFVTKLNKELALTQEIAPTDCGVEGLFIILL